MTRPLATEKSHHLTRVACAEICPGGAQSNALEQLRARRRSHGVKLVPAEALEVGRQGVFHSAPAAERRCNPRPFF